MKTLKIKIAAIVLAGLAFSCKKSDTVPTNNYTNSADSTKITKDTIGPNSDTTAVGAGTTGATGEGSTGSGSAGTTQKGNPSVNTDSTSTSGK